MGVYIKIMLLDWDKKWLRKWKVTNYLLEGSNLQDSKILMRILEL